MLCASLDITVLILEIKTNHQAKKNKNKKPALNNFPPVIAGKLQS